MRRGKIELWTLRTRSLICACCRLGQCVWEELLGKKGRNCRIWVTCRHSTSVLRGKTGWEIVIHNSMIIMVFVWRFHQLGPTKLTIISSQIARSSSSQFHRRKLYENFLSPQQCAALLVRSGALELTHRHHYYFFGTRSSELITVFMFTFCFSTPARVVIILKSF